MKKFFILILLLFSSTIWANTEKVKKVDKMIKGSLVLNEKRIQEEAKSLSYEEKQYLLKNNTPDISQPLLYNLVFAFGIGSYKMGDFWGGLLGSTTSLLTTAGYVSAVYFALDTPDKNDVLSIYLFIGAGVFTAISVGVHVVRPFTYLTWYTNKLKKALLYEERVNFTLAPLPNPTKPEIEGAFAAVTYRF